MREVYLIRHAYAERRTKKGERYVSVDHLAAAVARGRILRNSVGIDFSVSASSSKLRAIRTAEALSRHLEPEDTEIIPYDFLGEFEYADYFPGLSRAQITESLSHGLATEEFKNRGLKILDALPALDPQVQAGVTHGSVLAAVTLASYERGTMTSSMQLPNLIVPNLGFVAVRFD